MILLHFDYTAGAGHVVTIQWYHDGVALADGTFGGVTISGSTTTTLTIENPTEAYNGSYNAIVRDVTAACEVSTNIIEVTVPGVCTLELTSQPVPVHTSAGQDVELMLAYSGTALGTITVQWYKDDVPLVDGTYGGVVVSGSNTTTLTLQNVSTDYAGSYFATVIDDGALDCSVQTNTVLVEVDAVCVTVITAQPDDFTGEVGDTVVLSVAYLVNIGPATLQWYQDGVALVDGPSGDATIAGATTDTLTITNAQLAQSGQYTVTIVDTGADDCTVQSDVAVVLVELPSPPANMYIWYKADAEGFNDGDLAFPWQDWSGGNHDAVINSDAIPNQPTFATNELNTLPVFEWAAPQGTGNEATSVHTNPIDLPGSGFSVASTGYTFAIVINRTSLSPIPSFNDIVVATLNDQVAATQAALRATSVGANCTYKHHGRTTNCSITVALNSWQIITGTFDFTEGIPRLRTNDDTAVGPVGMGSIFLNLAFVQLASIGAVAEVLYYNTKLSDADLDQLRNYLSLKWGIPITV